jgi:hypothetical protein
MDERTWAPADEGDLAEQGTEVERGEQPSTGLPESGWDADAADVLEQSLEVGGDDGERDPPA